MKIRRINNHKETCNNVERCMISDRNGDWAQHGWRKKKDFVDSFYHNKHWEEVPEPEWVEMDLNECSLPTPLVLVEEVSFPKGIVTVCDGLKYKLVIDDGYVKVSELLPKCRDAMPTPASLKEVCKIIQRPVLTVWEKK